MTTNPYNHYLVEPYIIAPWVAYRNYDTADYKYILTPDYYDNDPDDFSDPMFTNTLDFEPFETMHLSIWYRDLPWVGTKKDLIHFFISQLPHDYAVSCMTVACKRYGGIEDACWPDYRIIVNFNRPFIFYSLDMFWICKII